MSFQANMSLGTNDYFINDNIQDTIQQMKFFPDENINILGAVGWDTNVRLYQVQYQENPSSLGYNNGSCNINANLAKCYSLQNPLLTFDFVPNSQTLFAAGADGWIYQVDYEKGPSSRLGKHEKSCKEVIYVPELNCLISGGWDGNLFLWDPRNANSTPAMSYKFDHKIFTMSKSHNLLVVGMSEQMMAYFNLSKLNSNIFQPECLFVSHLKHQTRKVKCFPDGKGFVVGSIEGRCAVKNVNLNSSPVLDNNKNLQGQGDFAFRCHRVGGNNNADPVYVYSIHDIDFNNKYSSFITVGGDGQYCIWDKDTKAKYGERGGSDKTPLTAVAVHPKGEIFAFASGYDWALGIKGMNNPSLSKPRIGLHYLKQNERKK